jgi:ribosomal protein S18 acetylase RimI-like enzyme
MAVSGRWYGRRLASSRCWCSAMMTLTPALTIRLATPADADAIHTVTQAAYAEYRATSTPSAALAETAREVREAMYAGAWSAAIVEEDGELAGAVRFKVDARGLYFFRLAVHPDHRRRGVAQTILSWLEAEGRRRHVHRLWCQVRLIIQANVALYTKNGFSIVEEHIVMRNGVEVPTATMEKRLDGGPKEEGPRLILVGVGSGDYDE